jgi:hypothetical protein
MPLPLASSEAGQSKRPASFLQNRTPARAKPDLPVDVAEKQTCVTKQTYSRQANCLSKAMFTA